MTTGTIDARGLGRFRQRCELLRRKKTRFRYSVPLLIFLDGISSQDPDNRINGALIETHLG